MDTNILCGKSETKTSFRGRILWTWKEDYHKEYRIRPEASQLFFFLLWISNSVARRPHDLNLNLIIILFK